jgi:7-cyano-7-deazaguanine synthase
MEDGRGRACVVLLSGGLDSTTVLALLASKGWTPFALSIRYGQRHGAELDAARTIARHYNVARHVTVDVDLRAFGGSALTDDVEVPKHRSADDIGTGIPVTYVPARNTVFLSCALAYAETVGAFDIAIGVNALDYSGYPDCRPEFIRAFESVATLATKAGVEGRSRFRIHTPLMQLTKAEIVKLAASLGVDFSQTLSCYDPTPDGHACGACDACLLRAKGFAEAGVSDDGSVRR